ncbi:MAG: ATP-binding protein [Candidatus Magnetominusculus sp. LBB02]|nr:ATP-binding protein [Candidatus Magnetominusculus sp. LBB02]
MNKRVIVIDDEEAILNDYKLILSPEKDPLTLLLEQELGGTSGGQPSDASAEDIYDTYLTTSGEDGFNKIKEAQEQGTPFAVAFIDMKMPMGWDGLVTAKMIRGVDTHIEIVIVTAYSETRRGKIVETIGMPERLLYVKKPFDSDEIRQLAMNLTRKWDIEKKIERHAYFLEMLVESVRRLKTINTTTLRALLLAILKEMMFFSDIRDGSIIRRAEGKLQLELSLCDTGTDKVELTIREIKKSPICPDDICYIKGCMVIPLRESPENCVLIVLATTNEISPERLRLFKLLADTSTEVLRSYIAMVEHHQRERLTDALKIKELETLVQERTNELRQKDLQLIEIDRVVSVQTLASGIAHEINNPLSFVRSTMSSLQKTMSKVLDGIRFWDEDSFTVQKYREYLQQLNIESIAGELNKKFDRIHRGTERIVTIVNNLKHYSRVDMPFVADVNVNQNIEEAIELIATPEVEFVKQFGVLPNVECCPQDINQALFNVISNAADAMDNNGRITISTSYDIEAALITIVVSDNGPGMPPDTLRRAFNPFFTTKPIGKGTGLGLSIAEAVIARHGGTVKISSEVGHGTTVKLTISSALHLE